MSLTLFKSRVPSCSFILSTGVQISFQDGRYATSSEKIISELKAEVDAGNPLFYIDPAEPVAASNVSSTTKREVEYVSKGLTTTQAVAKGTSQESITKGN